MALFRRLLRRLEILFNKDRIEGEMNEELLFHLEMEVEENRRAGMDPAEARRAALLAFGGVERFKARARESRGGHQLDTLAQDVHFAARTLLKSPVFSGATILVLGIGIGASTSTFSVLNSVVLEPLPYPEPDQLIAAYMTDEEDGDLEVPWSVPSLRDVAGEQSSFSSLTGWEWLDVTLTGIGDPALVYAVGVSKGMLTTFGLQPILGRDIRAEETLADGPRVAVISHTFWQDRLGGGQDVLGQTLQLSNETFEIVGVAPLGFAYPRQAALWVPGHWSEETHPRGRHFLRAIGRLHPGTSLQTAQAELSAIAARLEEEYPESNRARGIHLLPLKQETVGDVRLALLVLMGAVGMVLLIACANVANLLLARGAARVREVAVRATLGASRWAITRLLLAETGLLAFLGGGLGVLLAFLGVKAFIAASPGDIPRISEIAVDGPTLLFAMGLVFGVTIMVGFVPAYRLANTSIASVIREGREERIRVGDRGVTRSGLLTLEVALSLVLLLGAGLFLRSFVQIRGVEVGFDPENVQQFTITLPETAYDGAAVVGFQSELQRRLAALPGVESVGLINGNPLGRSHTTMGFEVLGREADADDPEPDMLIRRASPGYFRTLRIPLIQGRTFEETDREDGEPVAVISATAASRYWPGEDPLGKRFSFDLDDPEEPTWTIVGVVGDVRSMDLTTETWPEAYFPLSQWPRNTVTVVLRKEAGIPGLESSLRGAVRELDPSLPLYYVESLADRMEVYSASDRFYLLFLGTFATLATLLSAVGLYGVVAYLVSKRTREIGIRAALGAGRRQIMGLVLSQSAAPVAIGTVIGLGAALSAGRLLAGLLFQVRPWDPVTAMGATGLLLVVAGIATFLPARHATRIPPTAAMRVD